MQQGTQQQVLPSEILAGLRIDSGAAFCTCWGEGSVQQASTACDRLRRLHGRYLCSNSAWPADDFEDILEPMSIDATARPAASVKSVLVGMHATGTVACMYDVSSVLKLCLACR